MLKQINRVGISTALFYFLIVNPVFAIPDELAEGMQNLWDEYWFYIAMFVAIGVLTGLLAFIILFIRLGANASNPQERSRIFKEMMAVAVCTALLGGITLVITLYFALFN